MNQGQQFVEDALADGGASGVSGANDGGRTFTGFLAWGAATIVAGIALVLACTVLVDPYRLFGLVEIDGVNRVKPQPEAYREKIKLTQLRAIQPDLIFLGNSRTEIGFDPDSPLILARAHSAYNMGLAGTGMAVSQRMLEQAREAAAPARLAIVGVEFLDFLVNPAAPPPASAPAAQHGFQAAPWQWRVNTVFSLGAVADAVTTLRIQRKPEAQVMTRRGLNPLREYHGMGRKEGFHAIFQQRAQENAKNLVSRPTGLHIKGGADSDSTLRLRALLERAAQDGTEVQLIVYPYHAQLLAMFDEAGLHDVMQAWKRLLVHEAERVRERHPGARVAVWDFSGYGPYQCERIPAAGDRRSTTQWYWEGGHFKATLGELMLDRLFGGAGTFGFALSADSLEANAQRIAGERAQCASAYPELFAGVATMVARARGERR